MEVDSPGDHVEDMTDKITTRIAAALSEVAMQMSALHPEFDMLLWVSRLPSIFLSFGLYAADLWNVPMDANALAAIMECLRHQQRQTKQKLMEIAKPPPPASLDTWDPTTHLKLTQPSNNANTHTVPEIYYRDTPHLQRLFSTCSACIALKLYDALKDYFPHGLRDVSLALLKQAYEAWQTHANDAMGQNTSSDSYHQLVAFYAHITGYLQQKTFTIQGSTQHSKTDGPLARYELRY